jgi:hypothetical protein
MHARGWSDNLLVGSAFAAFVEKEDKKLGEQIVQSASPRNATENIASILSGPYRYAAMSVVR